MTLEDKTIETSIEKKEKMLRDWFTQGKDPVTKIIDGLDIGWGGVQRWATGQMPSLEGLHLDIACGYATFLAQLGWRFPNTNLVGLNIDFAGPHRLAKNLLEVAQVQAALVQADARCMPFHDKAFTSASCFLGLQDIQIGFKEDGIKKTLAEAARVLHQGGHLTLLDEFPISRFIDLLSDLPIEVIDQAERTLDIQWGPEVAERAIKLYAEGWVAQIRSKHEYEKKKAYDERYKAMQLDMEQQFNKKGHYVPFGPIRMIVARKKP